MSKPLYVTEPHLPPLEEFLPYLEQIWERKILTNGGPFHARLEQALCEHLGVEHCALFTNGTIALIAALQALGIRGEVITTPYSFVATAHSLLWTGLTPVFADIDPVTLNLDPGQVERAIGPNTAAILPVHCYGHPCDVDGMARIAREHGLKILYDAAHAFGVRVNDTSVLRYGDLSVLSFHATKVFNTFEGGAVVCPDADTKRQIDYLKNFGIADEVTVVAAGINGKMSELNAAFGLLQLQHMAAVRERRRAADAVYREHLGSVPGIRLLPVPHSGANYSYFPILVDAGYRMTRDALYHRLRQENIFARRYFYPLISDFPMYCDLPSARADNLPVATATARAVLCLPMSANLARDDQLRVVNTILRG